MAKLAITSKIKGFDWSMWKQLPQEHWLDRFESDMVLWMPLNWYIAKDQSQRLNHFMNSGASFIDIYYTSMHYSVY